MSFWLDIANYTGVLGCHLLIFIECVTNSILHRILRVLLINISVLLGDIPSGTLIKSRVTLVAYQCNTRYRQIKKRSPVLEKQRSPLSTKYKWSTTMKCQDCPFFKPSLNQINIGQCQQYQEVVRACDNACSITPRN